jgi:hypothetical protein
MALPVVKHTEKTEVEKKPQALIESNSSAKGPCVSLAQDPDGKFRHAGDDCNEVMPKVREELSDGIEKGEFIGHIYTDGIHHMQEAKKDAEATLDAILKMKEKAEQLLADAEAKIDGATDRDKEANEDTGISKFEEWEEVVDAQKAAIRFFKQLEANSKKVLEKADDGLDSAEKLTAKVRKADEASDHDLDKDALDAKTKDIETNTGMLMKQLEDAAGDYDCGEPPVTLNSDSSCKEGNTKFSPKCTVECTLGYTEVGSENTLRCVRQGKFGKELYGDWFGIATCLPMNCHAPEVIDHSIQEAEEIFYPNAAEYTCEFGFSTTGKIEATKDFSISCTHTGKYEPKTKDDICKPVECGEAPIAANTDRPKGKFYYQDVATYDCIEGSTLDQTAAGAKSFEITCQGNSFFTDAQECLPVLCGPPLEYVSATIMGGPPGPGGDTADRYFADEVKYACSEGYTTTGIVGGIDKFKIRCEADGNFAPMGANKNPQCLPITCGMAPTIPHGNLIAKEMFYSDEQIVTAHDGWSLSGVPGQDTTFLIACIADASYAGIKEFKRTECGPVPPEANGNPQNPPQIAVYEDEILYKCNAGFSTDTTKNKAVLSYTLSCQAGGEFTEVPNLGSCVGINDCLYHTCGPFGACVDEHLDYHCDCEAGYEQVLDDGSGEKLCGNIDDCGPSQCGIGTCEDLLMDYTCHCPTGYEEVEGPEEKTCERVVCGHPPVVENALTLPMVAKNVKQVYEDLVEFECQTGYALNPDVRDGIKFHLTCIDDKSFTGPHTTTTTTTTTTTLPPSPYLKGVQFNIAINRFQGWRTYYDVPYADHTMLDEIFPLGGECMLWGAKQSAGSSHFFVMAMGKTSALKQMKNGPRHVWENDVYWYSEVGKSNGFSRNSHLTLNSADVNDHGGCDHRLSWHMGQPYGGYRAGCNKWLNSNPTWRKVVMYGPCGQPAFLQMPESNASKASSFVEVSSKMRVEDSCKPVNCGSVPTVNFCSPDKNTAVYGDSIKYTCDEGYTIDGTGNGQNHFSITCEADQRLTDVGECQKVTCGAPDAQPNADRDPSALFYKDVVTVTCHTGYTLTGNADGDGSYTRECKKDGEITEQKDCKQVACGDIRDKLTPLNGVVDNPGVAKFPAVLEVTCNTGYTVDGNPPPAPPAVPTYVGYQTDLPMKLLTEAGWKMFYDQPYSDPTYMNEIFPPQGDCILWGSKETAGSANLKLAAMGKRTKLEQLKTHPYRISENNVYWYAEDRKSNGFSENDVVQLNSADVSNHDGCDFRLSWHLGQPSGGYRSGCTKGLNGNPTWRKIVMYGPCGGDLQTTTTTTTQAIGLEGVQINLNIADLGEGWAVFSDQPYSAKTRMNDILPLQGECMLWGAKESKQAAQFFVAAIGRRQTIVDKLDKGNSNLMENDVYWYSENGKANGFSKNDKVDLASADVSDNGGCNHRLSWHLGQPNGGYRAGCKLNLGNNNQFRKLVMYGPCGAAGANGAAGLPAAPKLKGIQFNLPISSLPVGWTVFYDQAYSDHTYMNEIIPNQGDCVLWGSKQNAGSNSFALAAMAKRSALESLKVSPFNVEDNGVYWYAENGKSNGFSKNRNVRLNSADVSSDAGCDHRLSWHLGQPYGGYRSGCTTGLNSNPTWRKVVMYGPCGGDLGGGNVAAPPPAKPIGNGILLNYPISSMGPGWTTFYDMPYSDHTYLNEILPDAGDCILWGAKENAGSSTFKVAAMGKRSALSKLKNTKRVTENNVYWYVENGKSNGFGKNNVFSLNSADTSQDGGCDHRLSWHLGQPYGGYRAGCSQGLNGNSVWRKVVMYGPCGPALLQTESNSSLLQLETTKAAAQNGATVFTAACQADGNFNKQAGCLPVKCGVPPHLLGAESPQDELTYEVVAKYTCLDGYTIGGGKDGETKFEVDCLESGEFDEPSPDLQCVNIDDCAGHSCGPHGACVDKVNDYECDCEDGFEENEQNGEKVCGNIDDCGGHDCGQGYCIDLVGDYMCDCPVGFAQEIVNDEKTCMPVKCADSAPSLNNGKKTSGGNGAVRYPSTLSYKCNDLYSTDGTPAHNKKAFSVTCSINGALEPMSSCQKIRCGTPPGAMNAHLQSPNHYATMYAGDKASYQCITGHKIGGSGNGAKTFDVKCKKDGTFEPTKSCEPVVCGGPPGQNYAYPNIGGAVTYGQNLVYTCHAGYTVTQANGGPIHFRKHCQDNGHFSGSYAALLDISEDSTTQMEQVTNETAQETKEVSFLQATEKTEKEDADENFDDWDDAEPIEDEDAEDDEAALVEEKRSVSKEGDNANAGWGRRRRDRRRRTRRRRCTTLTSTTTGYYGCHPIFTAPPCIPDVVWDWNWLNPFAPGGWDWFALMQTGVHHKEGYGTLKLIKKGMITTRREEGALIPGDTFSFSCPPGETISGDPNGAHGAIGVVNDDGTLHDAAAGGNLPSGCLPVTFTVRGAVINALTNLPVVGVKVKIGDGESTTSAAGIFDIEGVSAGPRTVQYDVDGFYTKAQSVIIAANTEAGGPADVALFPKLTNDMWVTELSWDSEDEELEMEASWGAQKVFFGDKGPTEAAGVTAILTQDSKRLGVTDVGNCNIEPLNYHCQLNLKVRSDKNMKESGAVAKLMHGEKVVGEFKISECLTDVTAEGKWWHVFTLNLKSNSLKWTCNGIAGAASLLQESEMSIPGKSSDSNVVPRKHAVDYMSYVGPFPGRFFRHAIKQHKNQTHHSSQKFLTTTPAAIYKKTKTVSMTQSKKVSATLSGPSTTSSSTEVSSSDRSEDLSKTENSEIDSTTDSTVQVSTTDPSSRIIKGKLTTEPSKAIPVLSSTDAIEQSTSLLHDASSHEVSSTGPKTTDAQMIPTTDGDDHGSTVGNAETTTGESKPDAPVSSTMMSSTMDVSSTTGHGEVSLKVEPSEVDVRPQGHSQPAKISEHFKA